MILQSPQCRWDPATSAGFVGPNVSVSSEERGGGEKLMRGERQQHTFPLHQGHGFTPSRGAEIKQGLERALIELNDN